MLACKLTLRQVRETDKAKSFNYEFSLSLELANSFTGLRQWEFSIGCTSLPRGHVVIRGSPNENLLIPNVPGMNEEDDTKVVGKGSHEKLNSWSHFSSIIASGTCCACPRFRKPGFGDGTFDKISPACRIFLLSHI